MKTIFISCCVLFLHAIGFGDVLTYHCTNIEQTTTLVIKTTYPEYAVTYASFHDEEKSFEGTLGSILVTSNDDYQVFFEMPALYDFLFVRFQKMEIVNETWRTKDPICDGPVDFDSFGMPRLKPSWCGLKRPTFAYYRIDKKESDEDGKIYYGLSCKVSFGEN